jgi:hypothetical protein
MPTVSEASKGNALQSLVDFIIERYCSKGQVGTFNCLIIIVTEPGIVALEK